MNETVTRTLKALRKSIEKGHEVIGGMMASEIEMVVQVLALDLDRVTSERDAAIKSIPHCCYYCKKDRYCDLPTVYEDRSVCNEFEWDKGRSDER